MLFLGQFTPLHVAGGDMFQSLVMVTAGGVNAAQDVTGKGHFKKVTIEQIAEWNPEIIFIPTSPAYTLADILEDPAWQTIKAVQEGKVYVFPSMHGSWASPEGEIGVCLGPVFIMSKIYPDLYSNDQLATDAVKFYELLGYPITAEELGLK
jgi:iron complex transport system substrate-binding protein